MCSMAGGEAVPNRPRGRLGLAPESNQIAPFTLLQDVVANYRARLLQRSKEYPHPGPDRGGAAGSSPPGDQAHHPAAAGPGLRAEESLRVGCGLNHTLVMKIENGIGRSVGPVEHADILNRARNFVQMGSQ